MGLIFEGLIFGMKFVLVIREAYIRGLIFRGLIFGILRYTLYECLGCKLSKIQEYPTTALRFKIQISIEVFVQ